MITICITIGVVALIICATVAYIMHDRNLTDLDAGDISKLQDIYIIAEEAMIKEADARREYEQTSKDDNYHFYFDNKAYKDAICTICKITEDYKNE